MEGFVGHNIERSEPKEPSRMCVNPLLYEVLVQVPNNHDTLAVVEL